MLIQNLAIQVDTGFFIKTYEHFNSQNWGLQIGKTTKKLCNIWAIIFPLGSSESPTPASAEGASSFAMYNLQLKHMNRCGNNRFADLNRLTPRFLEIVTKNAEKIIKIRLNNYFLKNEGWICSPRTFFCVEQHLCV